MIIVLNYDYIIRSLSDLILVVNSEELESKLYIRIEMIRLLWYTLYTHVRGERVS